MNFRHVTLFQRLTAPLRKAKANYSRKSNSDHENIYQVISKVDNGNNRKFSDYFLSRRILCLFEDNSHVLHL